MQKLEKILPVWLGMMHIAWILVLHFGIQELLRFDVFMTYFDNITVLIVLILQCLYWHVENDVS